jgi:hypothetical protein
MRSAKLAIFGGWLMFLVGAALVSNLCPDISSSRGIGFVLWLAGLVTQFLGLRPFRGGIENLAVHHA